MMKKVLKRITVIIMVLSMVFATACSKDGSKDKSSRRDRDKDEKSENEEKSGKEEKTDNGGLSVTLDGDVELNLKDDIGSLIKQVCDHDGCVLHTIRNFALEADENGNIYQSDKTSLEIRDDKDVYFFVNAFKKGPGQKDESVPGCMMFGFNNNLNFSARISRLSLLDGWKGNFSKIESYLDDENSIYYGGSAPRRLAVFKDGKLVPISELTEKYGSEADKIMDEYNGSYIEYYQNVKNMEQDQAIKYMNGAMGGSTITMYNEYDRIYADNNSEGKSTRETKRILYCMVLAMNDWGASMDNDHLADYGSIEWIKNMKELDIYIPCSHADMERVNRAPKADADED